jgi:hypothetical protein
VNRLLRVGILVLVTASTALGVVGFRSFSSAADARRQATTYTNDRHALQQREIVAAGQTAAMLSTANKMKQSFIALLDAVDAAIVADDHVVQVANGAVTLGNGGNHAAAIEQFKTKGEPGQTDVAQRTAALRAALADAQNTANGLPGSLGR